MSPGATWARPTPRSPRRSSAGRNRPPKIRRRSISSSTTFSASATCASRTMISATRATTKTSRFRPSKLFADILRDGPPIGVHTIIWCDSVNNMNRTLDRQGMKEFENRILFQMSANDSSTLIDTPGGKQARRKPGALLQRGSKPDREIPALRSSRGRMARRGQEAVCSAPVPAAAATSVKRPRRSASGSERPTSRLRRIEPAGAVGNGDASLAPIDSEPVATSARR